MWCVLSAVQKMMCVLQRENIGDGSELVSTLCKYDLRNCDLFVLSSCCFICLLSHTMWLGKSLQLLCILPFGILCLSVIRMMFVNILLAVCMLVGVVV